ncbi:PmoA family protein [Nocardiopsis mangrovi]|uniref:PmoA family protein n=1 Tax=Nocardiopsis mangrovi TaxID=1179818 RepID=A0ABV9E0L5_9ACTN
MSDPRSIALTCRGAVVAEYDSGADVDPVLSPRPHLHPVRTLTGTVVTETHPEDHRHHLGVGVAVADVAGVSFWGGTTFVRDRGPVLLANHGRQEHRGWPRADPSARTEELAWVGTDGSELISEVRDTTAHDLGEGVWALDLRTRLSNSSGRRLRLHSPATKGRPGAGYGGFFWRAPIAAEAPRCIGPAAEGEKALHGSRSPWLALSGRSTAGAPWTLVFVAAGEVRDPWFLRAGQYPGVGASLAWSHPLEVGPGGVIDRRVVTVVADGHPGPDALASLAAAALARTGPEAADAPGAGG